VTKSETAVLLPEFSDAAVVAVSLAEPHMKAASGTPWYQMVTVTSRRR